MANNKHRAAYSVVDPDDVDDHYEGTDVPGEFRRLTEALGCEQLAATLIRVPPHSDFEQGTGHFHDEIEELYLVTRGTLTMRFGDEIREVSAPAAVRVAHEHAALAPQRGRRAGRDVGDLAQDRPRRRDEDRRLLGGLARRRAEPLAPLGAGPHRYAARPGETAASSAVRPASPCPCRRRRTSTRCRRCSSSVSRSLISVVMMRAPVMPNGWPSAIAPPNGLSLSSSMPRSSLQARSARRTPR